MPQQIAASLNLLNGQKPAERSVIFSGYENMQASRNGMMNTNRNHFVCGLRLVFMIFEPLLCLAQVTKAKELPQWQERAQGA